MSKILSLLLAIVLAFTLIGCNTMASESGVGDQNSGSGNGANGNLEGVDGIRYTGVVTDIVGNYLSVQLGDMVGAMTGGEMPGGVVRGEGEEMPEGTTHGEGEEMPEGTTRGEGEEMPEGVARGEGGEMPEGGERPEGGMGEMSGGMNFEDVDFSEMIELTDEIKEFSISVGVPVNMFGSEMSFSQITEGMYLSITTDDDGNVLAVDLLG